MNEISPQPPRSPADPGLEAAFDGSPVLKALHESVFSRAGLAIVVGHRGAAKSVLARRFAREIAEPSVEVIALDRPVPADALRHAVEGALKRQDPGGGRTVAVVIDNAHELDAETIAELARLLATEDDFGRRIQVVLFGRPELEPLLADPRVPPLLPGAPPAMWMYELNPALPADPISDALALELPALAAGHAHPAPVPELAPEPRPPSTAVVVTPVVVPQRRGGGLALRLFAACAMLAVLLGGAGYAALRAGYRPPARVEALAARGMALFAPHPETAPPPPQPVAEAPAPPVAAPPVDPPPAAVQPPAPPPSVAAVVEPKPEAPAPAPPQVEPPPLPPAVAAAEPPPPAPASAPIAPEPESPKPPAKVAAISVPDLAPQAPGPVIAPAPPPRPALREPPAREPAGAAGGAPGLLLIARQGNTLEQLYRQVYRGQTAPAFKDVAALNPTPIRPGLVLLFPTPADGWRTHEPARAPR